MYSWMELNTCMDGSCSLDGLADLPVLYRVGVGVCLLGWMGGLTNSNISHF